MFEAISEKVNEDVKKPEFVNKLLLTSSYPLKQRTIMNYSMQGLTEEECMHYLSSRLKIAGYSREIFTPQATLAIYNISRGAPRVINNIATVALIYSVGKRADTVDKEAVLQTNIELRA